MIGLIVTGHGNFADGLLSSLKLIAGEQEEVIGVNFEMGQGTEDLQKNLSKAIEDIKDNNILVLSDLAGGSPYNVSSVISKSSEKNIKVISGLNLPMLVEAVFSREGMSLDELAKTAKSAAIDGIKIFEDIQYRKDAEEDDGI